MRATMGCRSPLCCSADFDLQLLPVDTPKTPGKGNRSGCGAHQRFRIPPRRGRVATVESLRLPPMVVTRDRTIYEWLTLTTPVYGGFRGQLLGCCARRLRDNSLSGCRGQPAGQLDWTVVALDGIGLLLFFVPGVIAFAVDFSNGTIYLPPSGYGVNEADADHELQQFEVPVEELTPDRIEQVVSRELNRPVDLSSDTYVTQPLSSIDAFWGATRRLHSASKT